MLATYITEEKSVLKLLSTCKNRFYKNIVIIIVMVIIALNVFGFV